MARNLGMGVHFKERETTEDVPKMNTHMKLERRNKSRFPLRRDMRYRLLEGSTIVATGNGETVDMSSGGVAFEAEQQLSTGAFIELSISWPVLLDANCPMRLVTFGRVVRGDGGKTVCTVDKYEFRTQARSVPAKAAGSRSDGMLQRWADGYRRESLKARTACV
jgi:hypothetical protein